MDTVAILTRLSQTLPSSPDSMRLTKYVVGVESEKYLLLAELNEIRKKIKILNQQINDLPFIFEEGMTMRMPTWDADVQDHAFIAVNINNLILEYDRIVERLIEGDFNRSGVCYEVKAKSTFWVFEDSDGSVIDVIERC